MKFQKLLILVFLMACMAIGTNSCDKEDDPTCTDGIQNGTETGIDCGGDCSPCISCDDGIQNGTETGVDCGGDCADCPNPAAINRVLVTIGGDEWQSNTGPNVTVDNDITIQAVHSDGSILVINANGQSATGTVDSKNFQYQKDGIVYNSNSNDIGNSLVITQLDGSQVSGTFSCKVYGLDADQNELLITMTSGEFANLSY